MRISSSTWAPTLAELRNVAADPEHAERLQHMRATLEARYDLESLEQDVLRSQSRRRLVAAALERGVRRPWDLVTDPERYVRGDFWGAVKYGQIRIEGTADPATD